MVLWFLGLGMMFWYMMRFREVIWWWFFARYRVLRIVSNG